MFKNVLQLENSMHKEKKWIGILMFVTFLCNVCFVFQSKMIYMSADEMGPIAVAALWSGQDWSSLMQHSSYYSYGYAVLLYPLFLLFQTPTSFYRAAIVLNAFLTALVIPISIKIGKKVFPQVNAISLYIGAFAAANFVSNIVRSPSAWCETLLMFLNWVLLLMFVELSEKINYKYCILSALLVVYTYTVHQRMIGVVIAFTISLAVLCWCKRCHFKYYLSYLLSLLCFLAAHRQIKGLIKASLWNGSKKSAVNDYSSTISGLFTQNVGEFIKNFIYTLTGHMFYIGVATMGLAMVALAYLLFKNWKVIGLFKRKQQLSLTDSIFNLYVLLVFLGTLFVSVLFLFRNAGAVAQRSDYLIYGRYVEPMLSIMIFVSIMVLSKRMVENSKTVLLLSIGVLLFGALSYRRYQSLCLLPFNNMNCVGIATFYHNGKILYVLALTITIIFMSTIWLCRNENFRRGLIVVVSVYWIITGFKFVNYEVIPKENDKYQYAELIKKKESLNEEAKFYYYGEEKQYIYNSSFIQFLLKGKDALIYQEDYEIPDEIFYAVTDDVNFLLEHDDIKIIDEAGSMYLVTNEFENTDDGVEIPLAKFSSPMYENLGETEKISSNGYEGIFVFGPYMKLDEGNYDLTISYCTDIENSERLGKAEVYCFNSDTVYVTSDIPNTSSNRDAVVLHFSLEEAVEALEFRLHTVEEQDFSLEKVVLKKNSNIKN